MICDAFFFNVRYKLRKKYYNKSVWKQPEIVTMKFALPLLAIVGLAIAAPDVQPRGLQEDLQDIFAPIPIDKIREIFHKYLQSDQEVQAIITYLKSDEWAQLVAYVANHPTWIRFKEYLAESGLNVDHIIQLIHDFIASLPGRQATRQNRSVKDLIHEMLSVIPIDQLLVTIDDKIQNSPEFKEFWDKISGQEAYALAEELRYLPEVERLAEELRKLGLDIDTLAEVVYGLLGWEF